MRKYVTVVTRIDINEPTPAAFSTGTVLRRISQVLEKTNVEGKGTCFRCLTQGFEVHLWRHYYTGLWFIAVEMSDSIGAYFYFYS